MRISWSVSTAAITTSLFQVGCEPSRPWPGAPGVPGNESQTLLGPSADVLRSLSYAPALHQLMHSFIRSFVQETEQVADPGRIKREQHLLDSGARFTRRDCTSRKLGTLATPGLRQLRAG